MANQRFARVKRLFPFLLAGGLLLFILVAGMFQLTPAAERLALEANRPTMDVNLTAGLPVTGDEGTPVPPDALPTETETPTLTETPAVILATETPTSEPATATPETPAGIVTETVVETETPTVTATPTASETPTATGTAETTETAAPTAASDEIVWSVEVVVPVSAQEVRAEGGVTSTENNVQAELDATISDQAVTTDVEVASQTTSVTNFQVSVSGEDGLDQFRQTIFGDLNEQIDLLGGAVQLEISGDVIPGQAFPLLLESNPSTGFVWEVTSYDASKLQMVTETEYDQKYELVGAPSVQTIRFVGIGEGSTTIVLFYGRPWLAQSATRRISVDAGSNLTTESLDLSMPVDEAQAAATPESDLEVVPVDVSSLGTLPATFDWRNKNGTNYLTPIRNQGSCGSCWAFGTVGVFESAIKIQGGGSVDLSEQYLVSCNSSGWSCSGGWFAHDYHFNRYASPQTAAGAVLESDFPYTASNATCSRAYNHPYKLTNWYSISGYSVPSVDQIKDAIYTYGPVAVAICVGPNFQRYSSGVFTTNEISSCSGGVNHAVLLTGWDDATQSWVLRNSWGTSWGESGYMRIRWGISNVGYGATYVVYTPDGQPTPTAGPTSTPLPTPTATATVAPPTNDNFDTPTVITLSAAMTASTTMSINGATLAYDDPRFACTGYSGNRTLWFRFTPPFDGQLTVDTIGSNYDTVLGIWQGTRGSLTSKGCNDDISNPFSYSSKVADLQVTKDQVYYIEAASYSASSNGTLTLNVGMKLPTPTDLAASDGTSAAGVDLTWSEIPGVTNYKIYRATSLTGAQTLLGPSATTTFSDTQAQAGITYTYWVTACSSSACSGFSSPDTGFRTLSAPVLTTTKGTQLAAVNISWLGISNAATYEVYRTDSADVDPLSGSPLAVISMVRRRLATSYSDRTAVPGVDYYYWVRACKNPVCGGFNSTPTSGWRGLAKTTRVNASDNADLLKVVVTWTADVNATRYEVYRSPGAAGVKTLLGADEALALRFEDTTAEPGVIYYYTVRTCRLLNCSDYSVANTGWRSVSVPTNLSAADGSSASQIDLTWDAVPGATAYRLYRAGSLTSKKVQMSTVNTTLTDKTVTNGPLYYYWVAACVGSNCSALSPVETGFRKLAAPASMVVSDGAYRDRVLVKWSKVAVITSYQIYRSDSLEGEKTLLGTTRSVAYYDMVGNPGFLYYYWIKACNAENCGDFSSSDTGWKGMTAPAGLTAQKNTAASSAPAEILAVNNMVVTLSWQGVPDATSYIISRARSARGSKEVVGTTSDLMLDDTVTLSYRYYYFVQSCIENRCSAYSPYVYYAAPKTK